MDLKPARLDRIARRSRRWFAILAVGMAFPAAALQMGVVQLESFLAQPLLLRIPVIADEGGAVPDAGKFRARVLPADAYVRHGLEPPGFSIDGLSAKVTEGGAGRYWLIVKSGRVFSEPAATLLVELSDGRQTIVRQVELLLDPEPVDRGVPEVAVTSVPAAEVRPEARAPESASGVRSYGPVRRGETLVEIAQRVRPNASADLDRVADALREANPALANVAMDEQAPVGAVLRVPALRAQDLSSLDSRRIEANEPVVRPAPARETARPAPRESQPRVAPPPPTLPPVGGVRQQRAASEPLALATELESYAGQQGAAETLEERDRKEPARYRADWTLDSLQESAGRETESQTAPVAEGSDAQDDALEALDQLRALVDDSDSTDDVAADVGGGEVPRDDVIIAEPLAADETATEGSSIGGSWLITLMLIFGGVAAWAAWPRFGPRLVDQWRARQVPGGSGAEPVTAAAEASGPPPEVGPYDSMPDSLRELLTEARESSEPEIVRQAAVAEVMALRGHHADAERILGMALGRDRNLDADGGEPEAGSDGADDAAVDAGEDFDGTAAFDEPLNLPADDDEQFGRTVTMDAVPGAAMEAERTDIEQDLFELLDQETPISEDAPLDLTLNGDDDEEPPIELELEPELDADAPIELEMSEPYDDQKVAEDDSEPVELELDLAGLDLDEPAELALNDLEPEQGEISAESAASDDEELPDPVALRDLASELKSSMRHDEQLQKVREAEAMIDDGQLVAAARLLEFLRDS